MRIFTLENNLTQNWVGEGTHEDFSWGSISPIQLPAINVNRDISSQIDTLTFNASKITCPYQAIMFGEAAITNATYTISLNGDSSTGTFPDLSYTGSLYGILIGDAKKTITIQHAEPITIPYSFSYSASVRYPQHTLPVTYSDFTVTLEYSGKITIPGFLNPYASVNGRAHKIKSFYVRVGDQNKRIMKLYASVNGKAKKIYDFSNQF